MLKQDTGRKWLLIFDNVEKIADISPNYMPTTKGSVLITSRYHDARLPDSFLQEIKPFPPKEGLELFKQLLTRDSAEPFNSEDEAAALELVKSIDGLALGLHQLAALLNDYGNTISRFRDLYEKRMRVV